MTVGYGQRHFYYRIQVETGRIYSFRNFFFFFALMATLLNRFSFCFFFSLYSSTKYKNIRIRTRPTTNKQRWLTAKGTTTSTSERQHENNIAKTAEIENIPCPFEFTDFKTLTSPRSVSGVRPKLNRGCQIEWIVIIQIKLA